MKAIVLCLEVEMTSSTAHRLVRCPMRATTHSSMHPNAESMGMLHTQVFAHTNARHVVLATTVPTSQRLWEAIFCKEDDGYNETGSQTCSHGSRSQLQCLLFGAVYCVRCGM